MDSFEEKLIQKECSNLFKEDVLIDYTINSQKFYALNLISSYLNLEEKILAPLNISSVVLSKIHEDGFFDEFIKKGSKIYYYDLEEEKKKNHMKFQFNIKDPSYLNFMLEEYKFTSTKSLDLAFDFYIQSFIDCYNEVDNGYFIRFPSKKKRRYEAMKNQEQSILKMLNEVKFIAGFTSDNILITDKKTDLLELISNYKNKL